MFGAGAFGLVQVPLTFLAGTVFYLLRRTSGTLITAMVLHAFWDFSAFAAGGTLFTLVGGPLVGLAALIVVFRQTRHETPIESAPAAA